MLNEIKHLTQGYATQITSSDRSWEDQLKILLNPRYKDHYPNIKKRFLKSNGMKELPNSLTDLTAAQKEWWRNEIMKQAGLPKGFAHVGGNAVDISVQQLGLPQKKALLEKIEASGEYKVYLEKVLKHENAKYGVPIDEANVFHIFKMTPKKNTQNQPSAFSNGKDSNAGIADFFDDYMNQRRKSGTWI